MTDKEFIEEKIKQIDEAIKYKKSLINDRYDSEGVKLLLGQKERFESIKQDLEKLDILKKWFVENIEDYSFSKYPNYWVKANYIYDDNPIFNVIKEVFDSGRT